MIISSDQYEELNDLNGKDIVTIERTILVRNVNNVPLNITLVLDEDSEKFLELIDENFVLEPGNGGTPTEKKARFNINIKNYGGYDGKINVLFAPIGVDEPGVALSSTIIVNAKKDGENIDPEVEDDSDSDNVSISPLKNLISGGNLSKGVIFLGVSTIILLIILILLVYYMKKKKSKQNQTIEIVKASDKKMIKEEIKKETKSDKELSLLEKEKLRKEKSGIDKK